MTERMTNDSTDPLGLKLDFPTTPATLDALAGMLGRDGAELTLAFIEAIGPDGQTIRRDFPKVRWTASKATSAQ